MTTKADIVARLDKIGDDLRRLSPHSHNPEKYHEDKSELLRDIGRLRADVRQGING